MEIQISQQLALFGQSVLLGLGVLHLAVEAAQLQSDRRQNHQDQNLGEDASSGPLLWLPSCSCHAARLLCKAFCRAWCFLLYNICE